MLAATRDDATGSQTSITAATAEMVAGARQSRDAQATMNAADSTAAIAAQAGVGATRIDAPGVAAATVATRSRLPSSGCAASASSDASGWIGASSMPRNSMGWASARSGVAARLVSGATRLMRPNTHATIGADPIVATVVPTRINAGARASDGRRCNPIRRATRPAAIIDVTPTTLSW